MKLLKLYMNNKSHSLSIRKDIIKVMNKIYKICENNDISDFIDIIIQYKFKDSDLLILSPTPKNNY